MAEPIQPTEPVAEAPAAETVVIEPVPPTPTPAPRKRRRWLGWVIAAVVLVILLIVGFIVGDAYARQYAKDYVREQQATGAISKEIMDGLVYYLDRYTKYQSQQTGD